MYEVRIKGFVTLEAAVEFAYWYEGQGEQNIDVWWECRQDEGKNVGNSSPITVMEFNSDGRFFDIDGNVVTFKISQ